MLGWRRYPASYFVWLGIMALVECLAATYSRQLNPLYALPAAPLYIRPGIMSRQPTLDQPQQRASGLHDT